MFGHFKFAFDIAHHIVHYGHYHISMIPEAYLFSKVIASTLFAVAGV